MKTWNEINAELLTLLGNSASLYTEPLRRLAFNKVMEYFAMTHTALLSGVLAAGVASDSGGADLVFADGSAAPGGMITPPCAPIHIQTADGWLEPRDFVPGAPTAVDGYTYTGAGIKVWDGSTEEVTVWYYSFYPDIVDTSSVCLAPSWAVLPLEMLCHVFLLNPSMMAQENLRQFQTKREAGDPEDNPPRAQANFYFRMYRDLIGFAKPQTREMMFNEGAR
jgi:hypothetical protein